MTADKQSVRNERIALWAVRSFCHAEEQFLCFFMIANLCVHWKFFHIANPWGSVSPVLDQ